METLIEQYKSLKEKNEQMSLLIASEEATFRTLKQQYDDSLAELKEKFGVSSIEQAKELYAREEQSLEEALKKAKAVIDNFNGSSIVSEV